MANSVSTPALPRSTDNRVVAGVAGGLGHRTGIEPDLIRAGFVTLTFAGGVGAVMYALGWLLGRGSTETDPEPIEIHQRVAVGIMFAGTLLLLRSLGLWFGDEIVLPVALFSFGAAAIFARRFGEDRDWLARITSESGGNPQGRIVVGGLFLVAGITVLLGSIDAIEQAGLVALAVAITAAGLFLVLGPWLFRLIEDLGRERTERIRADERADVAAHLHDSVLQTLSLIQRTDDPRRMATLARAQERELRSWLYATEGEAGLVHAAIRETAARIEEEYDVPIDVVAVGDDAALSDTTGALVQAAGEAMTNAAKHSEADKISVFVERSDERLEVFVSDQGVGFDPEGIPDDRHGISASIVGRMERHGGGAEISTESGRGTEVHIWVTA
jgi:signal transduction histidine kinase/phage shock protein PspC (stress-responsive transcriptional regulator)